MKNEYIESMILVFKCHLIMSYVIDITKQKVKNISSLEILDMKNIFRGKKRPNRILVTMIPLYEDENNYVEFGPVLDKEITQDTLEEMKKTKKMNKSDFINI